MKTSPLFTAMESATPTAARHTYGISPRAAGIVPQAESGCIIRCTGATAAAQCSYCGTDFDCWDNCAGTGRGACVSNCFN